jgi:hypothetical protein
MKYIAFIVLGLVLLAAIGGIVLWANMPTAKLTVHAVRPMGTNVLWTNSLGNQERSRVWDVTVANSAHAPARWSATVLITENGGTTHSYEPWRQNERGKQDEYYYDRISPGEEKSIYMLMPSDPKAMWTVEVRYKTQMNTLEEKLSSWLKPVPMLRRAIPGDTLYKVRDAWHTGTNVTTAR